MINELSMAVLATFVAVYVAVLPVALFLRFLRRGGRFG